MTPAYRTIYAHLKLPENIGVQKRKLRDDKEELYFFYIFPNGKQKRLGKDLNKAKTIANALNTKLYNTENQLDNLIKKTAAVMNANTQNPPIPEVIKEFEDQWLMTQGYAKTSLVDRKARLRQYSDYWEDINIQTVSTFDISQFLQGKTNEAIRQHRILLIKLFMFAKSKGYYSQSNPVTDIIKPKQLPRMRHRHTWHGYNKIKDTAEEWLSITMGAAFYSLQRRSDLVRLNTNEHIDLAANTITIKQSKSKNYDAPVFIKIKMGSELRSVVDQSYKMKIPGPHLVRCKPKMITKKSREAKPHPFAVLPDYLTKHYAATRKKSEVYDYIEASKHQPAFHDIRALGIFAYFKAGYSIEYIQALAGHATEKMTIHYRDGHEKLKPVEVEAGMSLSQVNFSEIDWENDLPGELLKLIENDED